MHSFTELVDISANFTLEKLAEVQRDVIDMLQTSGATYLVKSLQMIQLQKAIMAVGMFSIFEAILQDRLEVKNGFAEANKILDRDGESDLKERFSNIRAAVNVLKHGRGKSYDMLLAKSEDLPFKIKKLNENFFFEGDVSEISTLIDIDDVFVMECANVIRDVSNAITRELPECML